MKPISRTTPDPVPPADHSSVIVAGHPDDHLRMVVAIATEIEPQSAPARACVEPRTTWSQRIEAFRELMAEARPRLAIFDPDALDVGTTEEERWSDAAMAGQRSSFLQLLVELGREHSWTLLRPRPSSRLSETLDSAGYRREYDTPRPSSDLNERLILNALAPEVREMAAVMLQTGTLELNGLKRLVDDAEDEDQAADTIAAMVYDTLGRQERQTARTLSVLRSPPPLNGSAGPFPWQVPDVAADGVEVSRSAVERLSQRRLLRKLSTADGKVRAWIPRSARRLLETQIQALDADRGRAIHGHLAAQPARNPLERADRHHHALCAGDLEAAFEDAPYASDARLLAYRLSRQEKYAEAADAYRRITGAFDEEDAYAWEYLAWNLERQHGSAAARQDVAHEITAAYGRAHELEPTNPLYHGRWLAFRARCGASIVDEFLDGLTAYTSAGHRFPGSVTWYAEPVLKVLGREVRRPDLDRIRSQVGSFLASYERLEGLLR